MQEIFKALISYWHPKLELCGFVDKNNNIVEVENKHVNPANHFAIDDVPADAVAMWHTHPSGCCNLSTDDYHLFRRLPKLIHIIVGREDVAYYFIDTDEAVLRGDDNVS